MKHTTASVLLTPLHHVLWGSQLPPWEDAQPALWEGPQDRELKPPSNKLHKCARFVSEAPQK